MKPVIALLLVVCSQLLGPDTFAIQRADSGRVTVLRHLELPHIPAKGLVINKVGFIHHLCNLVRVEDETEENLYKKISSTGSLVLLCSTAPSCDLSPSFANSIFFSRPLFAATSCRYIVHRVLRI